MMKVPLVINVLLFIEEVVLFQKKKHLDWKLLLNKHLEKA